MLDETTTQSEPVGSDRAGGFAAPRAWTEIRIGNGFDIHRFADHPERPLVLGGVRIPDEVGLIAHSDGDAVAHACADALLGAAGLGDIGARFPDTDERWRGADSMALLCEVTALLATESWRVMNVDCSVVTERPKLAPFKGEMERALSDAVLGPVSVKGRRPEGVGDLGAGVALVCLASALIVR